MTKLLDKFFLAILAFYNKEHPLLFNIPPLMAFLMGFNIISVLTILSPPLDNLITLIVWVSIPVFIHTILCIIYSYDKRIHMIERLRALPQAVVVKYKTTLIVYSILSVGFMFFAVYFAKNYTIDWSWLFQAICKIIRAKQTTSDISQLIQSNGGGMQHIPDINHEESVKMLKLLDKFYLANLAFYNKRYRLLFNIPALMAAFMLFNIISLLEIFISLDELTSFILWISGIIFMYITLCIIYNFRKQDQMIERLKALPKAVVLKYKITLIIYYSASIGLLFFSAYFMKNYTIDWSWLFQAICKIIRAKQTTSDISQLIQSNGGGMQHIPDINHKKIVTC